MFIPFLLVLLSQSPQASVGAPIPAKELKAVPGPVAPTYPDPARGLDSGRMELEMRRTARHASVPTVALPMGASLIEDQANSIPGWKGYRAEVAPQSILHMRLKALHEAWFQVRVVSRWGRHQMGMLHNRIPTGNPEASFRNFTDQMQTVYFIVDTTQTSIHGEPYTLQVTPGPLPEAKKK